MGKEVKLGLALIGVLLTTFGGVLYWRLFRSTSQTQTAAPIAAQAATDPNWTPPVEKPTVVTASAELEAPQADSGQEGGGRWRDRFARQAATTAEDRAEPSRSFLPDVADVSTDPRLANQAPPAGTPGDLQSNEPQAALPAAADQSAPLEAVPPAAAADGSGGNVPAGDSGPPAANDPNAGVPPASQVGNGPPGTAAIDAEAGPGRFGTPRSVLRTASHDQYAADTRSGYGNPPQDRYAPAQGEPAGLPAGRLQAATLPQGRAEAEDSAVDPRARFAPGAYAGPGQSGAPTAAEPGKYVVQPNDNYWTVSEKVYGTGAYFKALHEHNRVEHPKSDRLQVGDVLTVPPAAALHRQYPDLCPKPKHVRAANQAHTVAATPRQRLGAKVYVVEQGDTLFDIARYKLGKASRWAEIYELNRDTLGEDFDYLRPGTELVMPTKPEERGDSLTRQPDDGLQR